MRRRVYGSSKYPWLTSFLKYVVLTGGTGVIAWYAHPYLLDELAELLKLDYKVRSEKFACGHPRERVLCIPGGLKCRNPPVSRHLLPRFMLHPLASDGPQPQPC